MKGNGGQQRQTVVAENIEDETFAGPSPNPKTNLLVADVALRGGAALVRHAIERGLLGQAYGPDKARKMMKRRSIGESLASAAVARLALRSVPGAILVGGGLLAKTLFERRKENRRKQLEREDLDDDQEDDLSDDSYSGGY